MARGSCPTISISSICFPQPQRVAPPEEHLAFFVSDVVDSLDLSAIMRSYRKDELRGRPGITQPAHRSSSTAMPRARSPRANWSGPPTRKCPTAFLRQQPPRPRLHRLFPQTPSLGAGWSLHPGPASLPAGGTGQTGTCGPRRLSKLKASASKHKAMSYARLCRSEEGSEEGGGASPGRGRTKRPRRRPALREEPSAETNCPGNLRLPREPPEKIREAKAALEEEARRQAEEKPAAKKAL